MTYLYMSFNDNMKSWWLLTQVLFSISLSTGHGAAIGKELCNCQPTLIRTPKILIQKPAQQVVCTKIPSAQAYTPIKNACTCVSTRVMPAPVARVECNLMATTPPIQVARDNSGGVEEAPPLFGLPGGAFFPETECDRKFSHLTGTPVSQDPPGPNGIDEPASDPTGNGCCDNGPLTAVVVDPVSLMIAQAEANRCRGDVHEGRLAFGQVVVPRDALPLPRAVPDVNEEGLYSLDKAIVELKTCKSRFADDSAALATEADALLALEDDALRPVDYAGPIVTLPSYADVGYQAETPSCSPLVVGPLPQPNGRTPCNTVYENTGETSPLMDTNVRCSSSGCHCTCNKSSPQLKCSCGKCSCAKCSRGSY